MEIKIYCKNLSDLQTWLGNSLERYLGFIFCPVQIPLHCLHAVVGLLQVCSSQFLACLLMKPEDATCKRYIILSFFFFFNLSVVIHVFLNFFYFFFLEFPLWLGSSCCGLVETNLTSIHEEAGLILGLNLPGLRIWCCCVLWCRSKTWLGSGISMVVV